MAISSPSRCFRHLRVKSSQGGFKGPYEDLSARDNICAMQISHRVSFAAGAMLMLGIGTLVDKSNAQPARHVYELRMYYANPGKLKAVEARFRDHTDAIFKHHNMKAVGYWLPQDAPDSNNLFIYLLEHRNRQDAEK